MANPCETELGERSEISGSEVSNLRAANMERNSKLKMKFIAVLHPLRVSEQVLDRRWIVLAWENLKLVKLPPGRELNVYCRVAKLETRTSGRRFASPNYTV